MLFCQVNACRQGIKTNSRANALCPVEMERFDNAALYRAPGCCLMPHLGWSLCEDAHSLWPDRISTICSMRTSAENLQKKFLCRKFSYKAFEFLDFGSPFTSYWGTQSVFEEVTAPIKCPMWDRDQRLTAPYWLL